MTVREVQVRAGGGRLDYPVLLGRGLLSRTVEVCRERSPETVRWAVITDTNVAPIAGAAVARALDTEGLGGTLLTVQAGEAHKTREEWARLTDALLEDGFGRDGGVVAVGGGVVGDLAGFVAASFMRGIPVVQVPTSLLAMIDASVGGKTAVDTPAGKNLVGAFHPPKAVIVDPEVLASLPREQRSLGLSEAVKHGAILDAPYGDRIAADGEALLDADPETVLEVVHRSVELKADVVSRDEREGGLREILNFGHTIGHALEHLSGYAIPHGVAVARGMLWEARLGVDLGVTDPGTPETLARWSTAVGLPGDGGELDPEPVARVILLDKKVRAGRPRFVLLERPGVVARSGKGWSHPLEVDRLTTMLERLAG